MSVKDRDFRGAWGDTAYQPSDYQYASVERAVWAWGVPITYTATLVAPWSGVVLGGGAEGILSETIEDFTLAASGIGTIYGTFSQTIEDFTLSTAALTGIVGTFSEIIEDFALDAQASVGIVGSLNETLEDFFLAGGEFGAVGTLSQIIEDFTLDAEGSAAIIGVLDETLEDFTLTSSPKICFTPNGGPIITFLSPPLSLGLVWRYDPIVFTVTDDFFLRRVFVRVYYVGKKGWDFVYDGRDFGPSYKGVTNVRDDVSGPPAGIQLTILRDGGWVGQPVVVVVAVDVYGQEAVGTRAN